MKNLLALYRSKSSIFKNFSLLAFGTVAAKLIALGFYPFLTRLYTPEEFGLFSLFSSSVLIFYPIYTLYYQLTIPLLKDNREISSILLFTAINSVVLTSLFYLIISSLEPYLSNTYEVSQYLNYYFVFCISLILMAWNEILSNIATRKRTFLPVTFSKVSQSIVFGLLAYAFYTINLKELGLIYGFTFQLAISMIILIWYFRADLIDYFKYFNLKNMLAIISEYKAYPLYRLPAEIIMKLLVYLPILFYTYRYGKFEAGQIGLSLTLISAPISLIGVSIGKAYYAEIASTDNISKIKKLTNKIFNYLVALGIIPCVILYFFSVDIFEFTFGSNWVLAGEFTSVLAVLSIFKLAVVPLLSIFNYLNKQKLLFFINIITVLFVAVLFYLSYIFDMGAIATLAWFSVINIVSYVFTYYVMNQILSRE